MLDVLSGQIDMQERHIDSLQNKPTLSQNMKKGDYRLVELVLRRRSSADLSEHHAQGPEDAGDVRQQGVPQALSLGINRKEIIDLVYLGQSEPYQTGPRPDHPWYHEKLARQFTEYEPDKANAMLDKLGYDKKDGQGFRLRPDGQKVFFAIDVIPTLHPDLVDTLELVKRHWAGIGIDMKVNTIERALYYTRGDNNDHDAAGLAGPRRPRPDARPARLLRPASAGLALRHPVDALVRLRRQGRAGAAGQPEAAHEAVTTRRAPRPTCEAAGRDHEAALRADGGGLRDVGICLAVNTFGICKNNLAQRAEAGNRFLDLAESRPGAAPAVFFGT